MLLLSAAMAMAQTAPADAHPAAGPPQPVDAAQLDIVEILMPDGFPSNNMHLSALVRDESLQRLHDAQKTSTGKRAQQVAFLLATYGEDYENNRNYLKDALAGCAKPKPDTVCDSDTAAFAIDLYNRGDIGLLRSIMAAGHGSNGDLAETLGDFYATLLAEDSTTYLYQLNLLPADDQAHLCFLAGKSLGSERDVALKMTSAPGNLAAIGERCLTFVRQGIAAPTDE